MAARKREVVGTKEGEVQRLLDRIAKADDDKSLLGYARQVRALLLGNVYPQEHP